MIQTARIQNCESPLDFYRFAPQMAQVDTLIQEKVHSDVSRVTTVAGHIISGGGKRLRSLVALACSSLGNTPPSGAIALAACVEFLHTATLLHDDVVDQSDMRRGNPAANTLWGNATSVLVGDFLYARAFELMVSLKSLDAMDIFSSTTRIMAEGEVLQLMHANDLACTRDIYFKIIQAKTAALFSAAARVGGILAHLSESHLDNLTRYGENLGFAFQLVDDVLDYESSLTCLGKTPGDDFREGKITLPLILALEQASESERDFWLRALDPKKQTPDDFATAHALLKKNKIIESVMDQARTLAQAAAQELDPFPPSWEKDFLLSLTDYCITRSH